MNKLKTFNDPDVKVKHLCLALSFAAFLCFPGCGKRKPPQPPVERVAQIVDIGGAQIGNQINLVWRMPARNAPDGSALNISRADIYRLAEPLSAPLSLTEEEFSANSTLIGSIPIADTDFALNQKTYSDILSFAGQAARLRYAIRFVNASGQKAAFSNFFLIEPTSKIATKPATLVGATTQEAVKLNWSAPEANEDGSKPANILGYNLYRSENNGEAPKKLNDSPIREPEFDDNFFKFDTTYSYFARTVSLGADGRPIESSSSNSITILPKDVFDPSSPASITIAASPNSISIFFATNVEKDIAGYNIYRAEDLQKPKSAWKLLTTKLIKTNTFQDSKVRPGKTYYYYITATDNFGNVSKPSEVVSETAF